MERTVGNLTIWNLDDRVIDSLKAQARANERSLEGEIRHLLTQRADRRGRIASFRERTSRLAAATGVSRRLGFLAGRISVPSDFDRLGAGDVEALFEGDA